MRVARCHAEVHAALEDKLLAGAVCKQTTAWQLFWGQASANKGSTKPWHSFLAGLCKPLTKPLLSAQTECRYYSLSALFLGNFDHSAGSSRATLSTPTCKNPADTAIPRHTPSRNVARMDLDELRGQRNWKCSGSKGFQMTFTCKFLGNTNCSLKIKNNLSQSPQPTAKRPTHLPLQHPSMGSRSQLHIAH